MPGTALVPVPSAPNPDARAERFLARVAVLTPAQWGQLDAIGARELTPDVIGAIRRARTMTEMFEALPVPGSGRLVLDGIALLAFAVDLGRAVVDVPRRALGRERTPAWLRRPGSRAGAATLADLTGARLQRLYDLAAAQPGGVGPSQVLLSMALIAAQTSKSEVDVRPLYGPVESFIPFASLG